MLRNLRFCKCLSFARVDHHLLAWLPMDYLRLCVCKRVTGQPLWTAGAWHGGSHLGSVQGMTWTSVFQDACRMPRAQTWGQTEIPTQQARPGSHSELCQLLNHSRLFCAQWFVVRAISLRPQHCASSEWMPLGSFFGQVSCMEILWFKALTAATSGKMLNGRTLENMQLVVPSELVQWNLKRIIVRSLECRPVRIEPAFMCV